MNKLKNLKFAKGVIFDFDGVWTDNFIYCGSGGFEATKCYKGDSYGFSILKKFIEKSTIFLPMVVITNELNESVEWRCRKLGLDCIQTNESKVESAQNWLKSLSLEDQILSEIIFLGNDKNDIQLALRCGYVFAPADAHSEFKAIADRTLSYSGGNGFVREFCEIFHDSLSSN